MDFIREKWNIMFKIWQLNIYFCSAKNICRNNLIILQPLISADLRLKNMGLCSKQTVMPISSFVKLNMNYRYSYYMFVFAFNLKVVRDLFWHAELWLMSLLPWSISLVLRSDRQAYLLCRMMNGKFYIEEFISIYNTALLTSQN